LLSASRWHSWTHPPKSASQGSSRARHTLSQLRKFPGGLVSCAPSSVRSTSSSEMSSMSERSSSSPLVLARASSKRSFGPASGESGSPPRLVPTKLDSPSVPPPPSPAQPTSSAVENKADE